MYKVGDTVVHPASGVCCIKGIEEKSFAGGEKRKYYVLETVYDTVATTIHIPVDGEKVKLRRLLNSADIRDIIHTVSVKEALWIDDNSARKERFQAILKEGDHGKILQMICEIHLKRVERERGGKKIYASDSKILTDAERLIHQEFAHTLEIEPETVADFILSELNIG